MDARTHTLATIRDEIRTRTHYDEKACVRELIEVLEINSSARKVISGRAQITVDKVRASAHPHFAEQFLTDFGLSTEEGLALMCLAEALLRVPDAETVNLLIADKIGGSNWTALMGSSPSFVVNSSVWMLALTQKVIGQDQNKVSGVLRKLTRRIGEPAVRTAVIAAMRELGRQFVFGKDINEALRRAEKSGGKGVTYSFDMLGEAARTAADARRYFDAYAGAIDALGPHAQSDDLRHNPGISIKLSALHPRYETLKRDTALPVIIERALDLARRAKTARVGFNIDAEEAGRLDISLDIFEALLAADDLACWDGLGLVVQGYGKRAPKVIDWIGEAARVYGRKVMVRLVKGAYWDYEIKHAQVLGLDGYPVFTRKAHTDISYMACARKLMRMTDRVYPQFATHNAHSISAILFMAQEHGLSTETFEFQRLHGMGEALHARIRADKDTRCRIYAPVGAHRDLLAYLVRRLLENGANSSFVNQITDHGIPSEDVAKDPITVADANGFSPNQHIPMPVDLYPHGRTNARGYDIMEPADLKTVLNARNAYLDKYWTAEPVIDGTAKGADVQTVCSPHDPSRIIGEFKNSSADDIATAIQAAQAKRGTWSNRTASERAAALRRVADLYETHTGEFCALLALEAGKTLADCIGEIREAVDFLRYYALEAERRPHERPRGTFTCISPWNFPLAIFTGQIAAALAAGNAVLAKPAESTTLVAARAVRLFHDAGVPVAALQLLPGTGSNVGAALTSDADIDGVCFTGSTGTAQRINRAMAATMAPSAPLIAETGGLNAMIVDSTALPEQAVRDIVISAFQSAGQRCSALRMLYVQEDVFDTVTTMLFGAMDELSIGDPVDHGTDVGPVIDGAAKSKIDAYVHEAEAAGTCIKKCAAPDKGFFTAPAVIRVDGIADLTEEIFGPVLHIAPYRARALKKVIADINASGYGLTFGLHSRIETRAREVARAIKAGNIYINRNQIGAIVESQPFGGEGLSGTGPKAGGPNYLQRFVATDQPRYPAEEGAFVEPKILQAALDTVERPARTPNAANALPGPTGEDNQLIVHPRGVVLCLGPGSEAAEAQCRTALAAGCSVVVACPGANEIGASFQTSSHRVKAVEGNVSADLLQTISGIDAVALWADAETARPYRRALAARPGELIPLITETGVSVSYSVEQSICIDTTAAGGNASLLAGAADDTHSTPVRERLRTAS